MFKFGTSGIRDLTENLLKDKIAAKLAKQLSDMSWQELTLGRDGRKGSDKLMAEFVENFKGNIKNLGITTTPEIAKQQGLAVMITASHNPSEYCGFKLYLNHQEQSTAELKPTPIYNKWDFIPKDIVIDCANGGLGHKLKSLGFTNIINYKGEINKNCGATHPENLAKYCQDNQLKIGFAVDGDADRFLMFLDNRVLAGEEVTYLIAKLLKVQRIVIDETVNSALSKHFDTVRCKVGGHAVITAMQKNKVSFGAEKSGHYYFDPNIGASDAIDAIITISKGYRELGVNGLLKMLAKYKPYYQFNKNIKINELPENFEQILTEITLPKNVRKVIRKSGTEPLLRIMIEGKTKAIVDKEFTKIANELGIK